MLSKQRMTAVVQRLTVEGAVQGARLTTTVQCKDETERRQKIDTTNAGRVHKDGMGLLARLILS
ncbi:hypothetical protein E4T47_02725 [Aureobasidium subglaciale]|nr:hypothetical protein E4T43_03768 [Aureobasidium subglaciale]KAI5274197.1 hypothetical protein E4T47_02725 [Aureobasidium subglaciale]